jgi:transcriptional regulator GlxA family with amidase domain
MRVERAKRLLAGTDLTLDAVGAAVRFASHHEFSSAVRRQTGTMPRALRTASG